MISEKTISEVFDTARIEDVVSDYLNLKRKGSNLVGLCPFHNEKTPSFMVSPSKNIFKCFGCGQGGGPVQFLMEHEKYTYPEAIRHLAERYGIAIEESAAGNISEEEFQETESLHLLNQFALEQFEHNLWATTEGKNIALSYLKERDYLESTIRKFQLGYASGQGEGFKSLALSRGFSEERMKTLGLVSQSGKDFFRGRVIFPIHNLSGKVIAFAGRTLQDGNRSPKYINSPESSIYNKRKVLYGLHLAKNAIRKADVCFLVEGYTDVISMFQSGIENVVASSGTALTVEQIKSIKRFTPNVTVVYDGDEAGLKAAMRGLDLMLEEDLNVRLVMLPEGRDPDSMIKERGSSEFLAFLENSAEDFILFKTRVLSKEGRDNPIQKARIVRDIVASIAHMPDAIKRSTYIQQCAIDLHMDERLLAREVNSAIADRLKMQRKRTDSVRYESEIQQLKEVQSREIGSPAMTVTNKDSAKELAVVRILLQFGTLEVEEYNGDTIAEYVLGHIEDVLDTIQHPVYLKIIDIYRDSIANGFLPSQEAFVNHPERDIREAVLEILVTPFEYSENWEKLKKLPLLTQQTPDLNFLNDCEDTILRFKQSKIHFKIEENKELIRKYQDEGNATALDMRLKVHSQLLTIKSQIEQQLNSIGIRL